MDLVIPLSLGFIAALAVAWLLLFPLALEALGRQAGRVQAHGNRALQRLKARWISVMAANTQNASTHAFDGGGEWLRDHAPLLAGSLVIILLPLAALLLLVDQRRLTGFDDRAPADNPVITALLEGEQLVPPPPLPPDVFVTREVEKLRPYLSTADRQWSRLDPAFGQALLHVFKAMEAHGYAMVLIEGFRSPERQGFLQAQGSNVTNAGAWQSYHQFGLAADCAFFRDGHLVISEQDPWAAEGYRLFGEAAQASGLTWGGVWTLRDYGHVERHKTGLLKKPRLG